MRDGERPRGVQAPVDLAELVRQHPDYMVLIDRERRYRWFNRVAPTLTAQMLEGRRIDDFVAPEHLEQAIAAIDHTFATAEATEYTVDGYGDGDELYSYYTRVVAAPPLDGEPCVLLLTQNITAQREAELALRRSEERFRAFLEGSPDYIVAIDADAKIRYVNRTDPSRTLDDLLGLSFLESVPAAVRKQVQAKVDAAIEDGITGTWESAGVVNPDRYYASRIMPQGADANADVRALIVITDITAEKEERRRRDALERQLEQAQRLESIGVLAGGVAHDFNNLLTVVIAGAEVAKGSPPAEAAPLLEDITAAASRASELVQHLLAFSRRQSLDKRAADLRGIVSDVVRLARRATPEIVELELLLPDVPAPVIVDRAQLEQVLMNLCFNARDALESHGKITLEVERSDTTCSVSVTDNGRGIEPDDLERIFEPFFTTKPVGQGTGLGLALVHGIVQQHDGTMVVRSKPGEGATFRLDLPRREGLATDPATTIRGPQGTETILVAEDEPLLRNVASRILEGAGYQVLLASDGAEAVELFRKERHSIDLVLLDAIMPKRTGWECYEAMREISDSIPIVFATGYAPASVLPERDAHDEKLPIISKPYLPDVLLTALREILDAAE